MASTAKSTQGEETANNEVTIENVDPEHDFVFTNNSDLDGENQEAMKVCII